MPKKKRRFEWNFGNTTHLWERHQVQPFEAEEAMKVMFSTEVQMIGSFIGVVVQGFFLCLLISWLIRRK